MPVTHPYICPHCGHRTSSADHNADLAGRRRGCERCGSALLFELLDDYYPAPDAAFFVADREGRLIGCGRNAFELSGLEEEEVIGQPLAEALGLTFLDGEDPITTVLEWGVRAQSKPIELRGARDRPLRGVADLFPVYEEEGGLLLVITPGRG